MITEKDIKRYVIKHSIFSIFWVVYFSLIFYIPIGNISGIEYIKALWDKKLDYNSLFTYVYPLILVVYSLMIIYNLSGIMKVIFSKERFSQKEDESDSIYIKISSRSSVSALVSLLFGSACSFFSLTQIDLSMNFGFFYNSFGILVGILCLVRKGKNKGVVEQHKREVLEQSIKLMKEAAANKSKSVADLTQEKINNLEIIAEYKKMYDDGIITQDEFERKKAELLK